MPSATGRTALPVLAPALVAVAILACPANRLGAAEPSFIRGDSNADGVVSLADIMTVVRYLFRPQNLPACRDAADFDDSGDITVTDLVGLANFIFNLNGVSPLPRAPYPEPGPDPTADGLGCRTGSGGDRVVGAALEGGPSCSDQEFLNDTGPLEFAERTGQLVDFIFFARNCLYGFPGQELRLPVGLLSRDDLDAFTLSVRADPEVARLERFSFAGTALDTYTPDLAFNYEHRQDDGFLAAAVLMDFEEPYFDKVLPRRIDSVHHVADLVVRLSPDSRPADPVAIRFSPTPGLDPLRPPIGNEFSAGGVSVTPGFKDAAIKVVPRERLFIRGDADGDLRTSVTDGIRILGVLFLGQPAACMEPLDVNGDGRVNLTDPVVLLDYLFRGGPMPARPFPYPGLLPQDC